MKITKFMHSCLLVEMPAPLNRTALFDPGTMSEDSLDVSQLEFLDDIIITHMHPDHMSQKLLKQLVDKFPEVHVTAPPDAVKALNEVGITASSEPSDGIVFFDAPHEDVEPLFPVPDQLGVHYLDLLSDPGDSHTFNETKQILALPISGPWASMIKALNVAITLKPKYVLPIHDWHLNGQARQQNYNQLSDALSKQGITFIKLQIAEPIVIET